MIQNIICILLYGEKQSKVLEVKTSSSEGRGGIARQVCSERMWEKSDGRRGGRGKNGQSCLVWGPLQESLGYFFCILFGTRKPLTASNVKATILPWIP